MPAATKLCYQIKQDPAHYMYLNWLTSTCQKSVGTPHAVIILTFFYFQWMYIVPFVILMFVMQSVDPNQAQGGGGGGGS